MKYDVKVLNNQSLFDVAIQHAGAPEAAFELAAKNGLSITDELATGSLLAGVDVVNKVVANYYSTRKLQPATGITDDAIEEGIEFWYVEYDLVVR
jgi:hypothetical protein